MSATTAPQAGSSNHGWRRWVPDILLTLATILTVLGIVSIWANRLLLNPENWSNTSTQLLQNQAVRTATADYLVTQLYNNVDVPSKLDEALPKQLSPLAGPLSGALRSAATDGAELALKQPLVENVWREANKAAAQSLVTIIEGGNQHVSVNEGAVTLNIGQILNDVAAQVGINAHLDLPPSAASITVLRSNQLKSVQDGGRILHRLPLVLTLLVIAMYAAVLLIARGRRRKQVMYIGCSLVVAGLATLLIRSLLVSQVPAALTTDAAVQPAAKATVSIATQILVNVAWGAVGFGLVLIVAAWFAGPMKWAVDARRFLAPFLRKDPVAAYAIAAGVLLLLCIWQPLEALGKPLGILIFALLTAIGVTLLRRQTAVEFPMAGVHPALTDDPTLVHTEADAPAMAAGDDEPTAVGDTAEAPTTTSGGVTDAADEPTIVGDAPDEPPDVGEPPH